MAHHHDERAGTARGQRSGGRAKRHLEAAETVMNSASTRSHPESEKALFVREMFARIAPRYDLANRMMTAGLDGRWRRRAIRVLDPAPGAQILDLCCGTGDLVFDCCAAEPKLEVTGIDFCAPDARARPGSGRRRGARRGDGSWRATSWRCRSTTNRSTVRRWASRCATSSTSTPRCARSCAFSGRARASSTST